MRIPATPEEAKELEAKLAQNDEAGDWITPIFPTAGIGNQSQTPVDDLLKDVGDVRVPRKPRL